MKTRNVWTYDETLEMLNIMHEQESLKAMNGRPFRKDKAFRLVNEELAQRGYLLRDPKKIEHRWKNLKRKYFDLLKDPKHSETETFLYFDEIDLLMKGKTPKQDPNRPQSKGGKPMKEESSDLHVYLTNRSASDDEEVEQARTELTRPIQQRRSQRTTKGKSSRYNADHDLLCSSPTFEGKPTEDMVYRIQRRLIDYQFELYSRAQKESDETFLQISRQLMEESNERFNIELFELFSRQAGSSEERRSK
uniref:Myb/SANT-like DNA-binding domain-containing protein n=1 Tax=Anopheles marajoara TaxID=58244 RepID=A0A2M4BXY2_9DIPT